MPVTIKDIARIANVSTTTVSKILNNKIDDIGDATVVKVRKIIKEENYTPNRLARSMILKKTKTVGLIIPDVQNPYFTKLVRGAEDAANERGYNIFFCNTDDNLDKEISYMNMLIEKQVDGIVLAGASHRDKEKEKGYRLSIPVIVVDRDVNFTNIAGEISIDNFQGAYDALSYLIGLGHKEIIYISGSLGIRPTTDRLAGYKKAHIDHGLAYKEENVFFGDYSSEFGEEIVEEVVKNKEVTGIFCGNDMIALGVIKGLTRKGYRIPENISIVGFDDISLASLMTPELTTIRQPSYDIGSKSINTLIDLIEKKETSVKEVVLKTELIIRETTAKRTK
ncbi:LacI family DNA-binding transcriptional regulator [Clostridium formicaceticum]|uniref:Catabolite control protein A n=1 Tax=Clostridium formicaceticum TaxID=1497 RepID=A0AAC9RK24_9CLOT|nr:LacI family DNA-binding transcriptional regulator [Clostridium formicaceticum]AOY76554.1 LacI family transcriptional regulator [Clostridium formicaceticum]ARE86972.1 Catabolite control protein A [Clostridium formicaceticum]